MKVAINSVLVWNSMWYFVRSKCMLPQTMETLGLKTKNLPRTRTSHFVNETEVCHNPQIHRFYRRQKKICDILNRTTLKYNVFLGKSKDKFFFGGHNTLTKVVFVTLYINFGHIVMCVNLTLRCIHLPVSIAIFIIYAHL